MFISSPERPWSKWVGRSTLAPSTHRPILASGGDATDHIITQGRALVRAIALLMATKRAWCGEETAATSEVRRHELTSIPNSASEQSALAKTARRGADGKSASAST